MIKRKKLAESYEAIEAFWNEADKRKEIPNMAVLNLPNALSRETQTKLVRLGYDDAISVLKSAIEAANNGSVKKLDELVNEEIIRLTSKGQ